MLGKIKAKLTEAQTIYVYKKGTKNLIDTVSVMDLIASDLLDKSTVKAGDIFDIVKLKKHGLSRNDPVAIDTREY